MSILNYNYTMEQLFDISDIQQANIFRVSTILYSNNTYDISPLKVHKKIIEDCLFQVYPNKLTAIRTHQENSSNGPQTGYQERGKTPGRPSPQRREN